MDRPSGRKGTQGSVDGGGERVCIVATQPATFERCREGVYPSPASYDRTDADFEYMAFYRTTPVSAVTHYAPVTERTEQRRGGTGPLDEADWEHLLAPFTDEQTAVVFELDDLVSLATPVANDQHGVRGAWYCTRSALEAATTLSELAADTAD